MDAPTRERTRRHILARQQHPAWLLLASRRAPLVLSCLEGLFEQPNEGVLMEDAVQGLAEALEEHAGLGEFDVSGADPVTLARRELRQWIRRALVIEREGRLFATDALESALHFVAGLDGRIMTSTASRLSVVQREIERLEARLDPDPKHRAQHLRRRIAELEAELERAESGEVDVPDSEHAAEAVRELYALATGLRADFRRVEDSWRQADRELRHAIVNEGKHRGAVVDALLDGHDQLIDTPEGRVFHGFQQQLSREIEIDAMRRRLRAILQHPAAQQALTMPQQVDLRWLSMRLVKESGAVIRVRARSERDVRSFLKTGLAAEHHRVGNMLNDLFRLAQELDWSRQAVRRHPSPLPPLAVRVSNLPLIGRWRVVSLDAQARRELELQKLSGDLGMIDDEFWEAFDGLDREALLQDTLAAIRASPQPLGLAELARQLPPTHDLETIALWLGMVREAGIAMPAATETVDVDADEGALRFHVPALELTAADFDHFVWDP